MHDVLGSVPKLFETIPDPHLAWMWRSMHTLELVPGSLAAKDQQLVMLAVATQAKCRYGTDFHAEIGRALGATEAEIVEVALLTGHTASFGAFLAGTQYDVEQFKREVRSIARVLSGSGHAPKSRDSRPPQTTVRSRGH